MLARLAEAVREGTVSASELVRTALDRIERLNPDLNAVTQVWAEEALAQAEKVDHRGAEGAPAGPPLVVHDNTDVAGRVTSFASRTMLDRPAADRSEVTVERMVAAGAVPIGRAHPPPVALPGDTGKKVV